MAQSNLLVEASLLQTVACVCCKIFFTGVRCGKRFLQCQQEAALLHC